MEGTGLHKRGTSAEGWEAADSASLAPILDGTGMESPQIKRVFSEVRHPIQANGRLTKETQWTGGRSHWKNTATKIRRKGHAAG